MAELAGQSVARTGSTISVDLSGGPQGGSPGACSHLALSAAEHTLNGYYGTDLTVILKSDQGYQQVPVASPKVSQAAEPFVPLADATVDDPVASVGGVPDLRSTAIWYISYGSRS